MNFRVLYNSLCKISVQTSCWVENILTCEADSTRPWKDVNFYQAMFDRCDPCFLLPSLPLGVMLALVRSL